MVRPPVDQFFSDQKSLCYGTWIVAIIIHAPINTRNSPYETFYPFIVVLILCSNTPYKIYPKKNIWNSCRWFGSMYGVKWTHRLWFFEPIAHQKKIPSWPQSELYTTSPWFELAGTFYWAGACSSSVDTSCIEHPTSSSSNNDFFELYYFLWNILHFWRIHALIQGTITEE